MVLVIIVMLVIENRQFVERKRITLNFVLDAGVTLVKGRKFNLRV